MHVPRFALRLSSILLAAVVISLSPTRARAANLDATADHVIGQSDFTGSSANQSGAISASGLNGATHIAIDRRTGRIWIADSNNNRVLSYPGSAAMANGQAADFVLGQPNFTSGTVNSGGISASSLNTPIGVAVDAAGNVFVGDIQNNRVLMYRHPLTTDAAADVVFGQTNFTSNSAGTTAATLNQPSRVALDSNGNLFVADTTNNRVLEYLPPFTSGMNASRVLGQADFITGTANAGGISATSLFLPEDLAFDANNNLYVADIDNNRVLKYAAGFGTHAAASHVYGQSDSFGSNTSNNGGLSASSLSVPRALAIDPFNNLYIVDYGNNRVVEYNSGVTAAASRLFGQINFTTDAGGVSAASLSGPFGCAIDNAGNLFVADLFYNRVLEYDLPIAAGAPMVSGTFPEVIAAGTSDFMLYVNGSGFLNTTVVAVNGVARPTTFLDFTTLMAAIPASDVASVGIVAITASNSAPGGGGSAFSPLEVYQRVPNDTTADRVFGQPDFATSGNNTGGISAHSMHAPYDLAIDKTGRLWVCDTLNSRVLSWASAAALTDGKDADFVLGQTDFISGAAGTSATTLNGPAGVLVDPAGNVYVADTNNSRVLIFNDPLHTDAVADVVLGQADFVSGMANKGGAASASTLSFPYGMVMDASGNLFVCDFLNNRVVRYTPPFVTNMSASLVFGQPSFATTTPNNGGPSAATLGGPGYAAVDSAGKLYVCDFGNNRVLAYAPPFTSGMSATLVFGQPDFTTVTPNTGGVSAQSMNNPEGVAFDPAGNLYVADAANRRILAFNSPLASSAAANRVFGQGGSFASNAYNNGGCSAGSLTICVGMAFDAQRNLYVCDDNNNRVLSYDHPVENPPVLSSAAVATPATVLLGQPVNFSASATDADNDALTFTWDFGDSTTGTGAALSHSYQVIGTLAAKVTITDGFGGTVSSTVMVTVKAPALPPDNPPVLTSAAQAAPTTVLVGQPVNFTAAASDPDNDAVSYTWDFGDGSKGTGASISHAYEVAGTLTATVTVDDGRGGTVSSTVMVTVKASNPLGDIKLAVKLNFAKASKDILSASGTLELGAGDLTGNLATVQIADLIETFTIAKTAKNSDGSFSLSSKGTAARAAKFKLTLSKKTFAPALASAGLVNMTLSAQVHVPITITLDGIVYQATATLTYTAKQGVSGKTK